MKLKLREATVLDRGNRIDATVAPVFQGQSDTDYTCASCDTVLLEKIEQGQVQGLVVKCCKCGTWNAT